MRRAGMALSLLGLLLSGGTLEAQREVAPARDGLETVALPDLTTLEPAVREQLEAAEREALPVLEREGVADAELAAAYGTLGQLYHAYGLLPMARSCYVNARRLDPDDVRWPHLLARLEEKMGALDRALGLYAEVRRLAPNYPASMVRAGDIFVQLDRPVEGRVAFQQALGLYPNSAAAHYGLGQIALSEQDFEAAVAHFESALEAQPAANRIHYSLAMAHRGRGDLEAARRHLELSGSVGVRVADPIFDELESLLEGERVNLMRGRLAFAAGRLEEARVAFAEAVEARPESGRARVNLATVMAAQGDLEGAAREYASVLEKEPENVTARFNLGVLLARAGEHGAAVEHLEQVCAERPGDLDAQRQLARSLLALGRRTEALPPLELVNRAAPDDEETLLRLVDLLLEAGRHADAKQRLDLAYSLNPDRGLTVHAYARLLAASPDLSLRDGEQALALARPVFETRPTLDHAETVALALAESGQCEEAAAFQRRLVEEARRIQATDPLPRLEADLARYEGGAPCRPPGSQP